MKLLLKRERKQAYICEGILPETQANGKCRSCGFVKNLANGKCRSSAFGESEI